MKAEEESPKDVKRWSNRVWLLLILGWFGIISGLGMFSPWLSLIVGLILLLNLGIIHLLIVKRFVVTKSDTDSTPAAID